jgi:uncharacterized lipoprotein YmbA
MTVHLSRRALVSAAATAATALLGGCALPRSPAPVWWLLDSAPPADVPPAAAGAVRAFAAAGPWWLAPIAMPAHLERDALLVPSPAAPGARSPWPGHRWAEPLAEALPRVLRADLAALAGEAAVLPAGAAAGSARARLSIEVLAFGAADDGRRVRLHVRWVAGAAGAPGRVGALHTAVPIAGEGAAAWVDAHRAALRRLAEGIVAAPAG